MMSNYVPQFGDGGGGGGAVTTSTKKSSPGKNGRAAAAAAGGGATGVNAAGIVGGGGGAGVDDAVTISSHLSGYSGNADGGESRCLICYSEDIHVNRAITPCGHNAICGLCHLRLRSLHKDVKCPICKSENEKLVVDADVEHDDDDDEVSFSSLPSHHHGGGGGGKYSHKVWEDYHVWGDELGDGFVYREDVGMFFPSNFYDGWVVPLFSLHCTEPGCTFTNEADSFVNKSEMDAAAAAAAEEGKREDGGGGGGGGGSEEGQEQTNNNNKRNNKNKNNKEMKRLGGLAALKEHIRSVHGLSLCKLCVESKRDFVSQLPRMKPHELKQHLSKGDGDSSGFKGHPVCEFCRPRRFYDLTKLHEHLNKDHYKCHVCEKQGLHNQFFKNYDKLSLHFDREHFLCHDAQCLSIRFVVFENEIDLRAHELNVHGGSSSISGGGQGGSTKIQLEFRVRRTGYDGSGYDVPSNNNNNAPAAPTEEDFQYGLNGEVFVPEELPRQQQQSSSVVQLRQENEPVLHHPNHAQRTAELRAEAQKKREEQQRLNQEEAFPTLGATAEQQNQNQQQQQQQQQQQASFVPRQQLIGWTSDASTNIKRAAAARGGGGGGGIGMTKEDFPSLGAPSFSSKSQAYPKLPSRKKGPVVANASLWGAAAASSSSSSSHSAAGGVVNKANANSIATTPSWTTTTTTSSSSSSSTSTSKSAASALTRNRNNASSLTADNFPSLGASLSNTTTTTTNTGKGGKIIKGKKTGGGGGGGGIIRYAAAESLAKKISQGHGVVGSSGSGSGSAKVGQDAMFFSNSSMSKKASGNSSTGAGTVSGGRLTNLQKKELSPDELASQDNFPSLGLGGGGGDSSSTSSSGLTTTTTTKSFKGKQQQPPKKPAAGSSTSTTTTTRYAAAEEFAKKVQANKHRQDASLASQAQVDNIKFILGLQNYKKLKVYTKDFVSNKITPETFINRCGVLFENGTKDGNFVNFMPNLVMSCPDDGSGRIQDALAYLKSLKFGSQFGGSLLSPTPSMDEEEEKMNEAAVGAGAGGGGGGAGWSSIAAASGEEEEQMSGFTTSLSKKSSTPLPPPGYKTVASSMACKFGVRAKPIHNKPGSGSGSGGGIAVKSAWNNNGGASSSLSAAATIADQQQGRAAAAAAAAGPKNHNGKVGPGGGGGGGGGNNNNINNKKKKNTKNDELRGLAFGGTGSWK